MNWAQWPCLHEWKAGTTRKRTHLILGFEQKLQIPAFQAFSYSEKRPATMRAVFVTDNLRFSFSLDFPPLATTMTAMLDGDANSKPDFNQLVDQVVDSYLGDPLTQHLDSTFLPSRARAIEIIELMRRVVFPGFFDTQTLTTENVRFHVGDLLNQVHDLLYEEVRHALRYEQNRLHANGDDCEDCDQQAAEATLAFLERIPEIRRMLSLDVQASFDGDPAAANTDETVFCYPGIDAIFIHRVAHELWELNVPLVPRIMTEYAHNETGIDIHPGATLGESFFIDHGTGVVIGETVSIGARVKLYQGVTLGAKSTRGGQSWKGMKRHPTIEDDVTIYGGAIILGDITIGRGSTIGGSVFVTEDVPPGHMVSMAKLELHVREDKRAQRLIRKQDEQRQADQTT